MIRTAADLTAAAATLGWSDATLGRALRLVGNPEAVRKRVYQMKTGVAPISGPVAVAVEAFLDGYRPAGFEP